MRRVCLILLAAALIASALSACHHLDDDRIPVTPVNIVFNTEADWVIYGVPGAMSYKRFIREDRVPASFPYTASTYTGFGGVLLLSDVMGNAQAYDLACPVECKATTRVHIVPEDEFLAECPVCHSKYNVFSLAGHPVSGIAAERGYALRKYFVGSGRGGAFKRVGY